MRALLDELLDDCKDIWDHELFLSLYANKKDPLCDICNDFELNLSDDIAIMTGEEL